MGFFSLLTVLMNALFLYLLWKTLRPNNRFHIYFIYAVSLPYIILTTYISFRSSYLDGFREKIYLLRINGNITPTDLILVLLLIIIVNLVPYIFANFRMNLAGAVNALIAIVISGISSILDSFNII